MSVSSRNTLKDTCRSVLLAIWASLSLVKRYRKLSITGSKNRITQRGTLETWQRHVCVTVVERMSLVCSDWGLERLGSPHRRVVSSSASLSERAIENLCIIFWVWKLTLLCMKKKNILPWFYYGVNFSEMQLSCKFEKRLYLVVLHILPDLIHYYNKSCYRWPCCQAFGTWITDITHCVCPLITVMASLWNLA